MPQDEGVAEKEPATQFTEPGRLLANDARPILHDQGFDDEQIRAWAVTYVAEHGAGDVDDFIRWIEHEQRR